MNNPKFHCRVHISPPLVHILGQWNPVQVLRFYSFKIHFTIVILSTLGSTKATVSFRLSYQTFLRIILYVTVYNLISSSSGLLLRIATCFLQSTVHVYQVRCYYGCELRIQKHMDRNCVWRYYAEMWEQKAKEFTKLLTQDRLQDTNAATEACPFVTFLLL